MSARILNLLAEPKSESSESKASTTCPPTPQDAKENSSECPPLPPPGLEKFGPPMQSSGQLAKASMSETVEDACLSSSGSTRFEEDGDVEPNTWYSQDWELSAWGQSYAYPTYPDTYPSMPEAAAFPAAPAPSEGAILSTTPLHPPALTAAPPSPAWEWPMPHMQSETEMMPPYAVEHGPPHGLPDAHLMHPMAAMQPMPPMAPPMVHPAHYPMPDNTFLGYGHLPVGPELQPPSATLGSVGHETGNCKPCAFVYTKGCQSGAPAPQIARKSKHCVSIHRVSVNTQSHTWNTETL